ncbi:related to transposase [Desulfotalea psychrophila LSv54]|uniref:Related to transposase n=1 Tax=Desulfotalea psychrophila (strain LSv54 / DSM 12343) TaxID=177439 RepID=Q6AMI2_DESPS|nr:related to transposase [Desulfotalea psychrophila LSv54]
MMHYTFIRNHHSHFTVKKMCQTLLISESGYYRWLQEPISKRCRENNILKNRIQELYVEHGGMVGSPMVTADLRAEAQFADVGKNRVARIMKESSIQCKSLKKYKTTTDSNHAFPVAPNILNRNFTVAAPNKVWVGDITYIKVGNKWAYLSVFIDLYSRIVVGWDLSTSLEKESTIWALRKAILRRNPPKEMLVHSDRGVQYASKEYRQLLQEKGFRQSMSRKGNCWDNAVAESFFHTLKTQYIHHRSFRDIEAAKYGAFPVHRGILQP